jgi:hypothetical protein
MMDPSGNGSAASLDPACRASQRGSSLRPESRGHYTGRAYVKAARAVVATPPGLVSEVTWAAPGLEGP